MLAAPLTLFNASNDFFNDLFKLRLVNGRASEQFKHISAVAIWKRHDPREHVWR